MRVTKTELEEKEIKEIAKLVDSLVRVNDFTIAIDFAEDAYALFKEEFSKRKIFKGFWELFKDIKNLYVKYRVGNLLKNVNFYDGIKKFLFYFMYSKLFIELDKLDPLEALEKFLKTFKPQPQQIKQPKKPQSKRQQKKQKKDDGKKDKKGTGKGKGAGGEKKQEKKKGSSSKKSNDKKGLSADKGSLPIDMTKFKKAMPQIEKVINSGLFEKEDFQKYIGNKAGIAVNQIQIGNIVDLIDIISKRVTKKELDIFFIARKKEETERYRRDEVLKSIPYPDNEMTIKNISNYQELLKTLPTEYIYDDDIFTQKLIRKELLVKDYQTRRLKKQALYLLIDISESMEGQRGVYASGIGVSLVRQAISEGSVYFLRFFDHHVKDLIRITNQKEANKVVDMLLRQPYSGGGTNIERAIRQAVKDIKEDSKKFEKAEIMVITDGYDRVGMNKKELENIKLHSTIIEGENHGLKKISDTYRELKSKDLA